MENNKEKEFNESVTNDKLVKKVTQNFLNEFNKLSEKRKTELIENQGLPDEAVYLDLKKLKYLSTLVNDKTDWSKTTIKRVNSPVLYDIKVIKEGKENHQKVFLFPGKDDQLIKSISANLVSESTGKINDFSSLLEGSVALKMNELNSPQFLGLVSTLIETVYSFPVDKREQISLKLSGIISSERHITREEEKWTALHGNKILDFFSVNEKLPVSKLRANISKSFQGNFEFKFVIVPNNDTFEMALAFGPSIEVKPTVTTLVTYFKNLKIGIVYEYLSFLISPGGPKYLFCAEAVTNEGVVIRTFDNKKKLEGGERFETIILALLTMFVEKEEGSDGGYNIEATMNSDFVITLSIKINRFCFSSMKIKLDEDARKYVAEKHATVKQVALFVAFSTTNFLMWFFNIYVVAKIRSNYTYKYSSNDKMKKQVIDNKQPCVTAMKHVIPLYFVTVSRDDKAKVFNVSFTLKGLDSKQGKNVKVFDVPFATNITTETLAKKLVLNSIKGDVTKSSIFLKFHESSLENLAEKQKKELAKELQKEEELQKSKDEKSKFEGKDKKKANSGNNQNKKKFVGGSKKNITKAQKAVENYL